ncbi:hypothetical protein [Mycolicibacterium mageritense]|uniref:Uncharacterized protein n=1 Tax=Mycolicibacterium mageritense TaxID=53462 RepID=A0AAI8XPY0_MYCME|nr:hypothetical protein [Mycolicibacterium mageritense]BDY33204.1 hypothetical protein hbim_07179 [Mycolicibacterium mageritense]
MSQPTIDQATPAKDQATFDADMARMRGLVDEILRPVGHAHIEPDDAPWPAYAQAVTATWTDGLDLLANWPQDTAAELLQDWRHGPVRHGAYCPCGSRLEIRGELDAEDYEAINDFDYVHQDCTASQDTDDVEAVAL